jgi:hypothetical protein
MKFTQLTSTPTAENLNNRVAQMFGSKIKLESFTVAQLTVARDKLANQLLMIENQANFDAIHSSEAYQKNRLFLKVIEQRITELSHTDEKAQSPYAIGMAQAMKSTGDQPPLKKSTITKAHDIAKSVEKNESEDSDFTDKQIKMAYGVLNDPKYRQGNYDGAVDVINKIAPGLVDHPGVANALKRANEGNEIDENMSRQHFQYVADTLKDIQDPSKRAEYAQHHSAIFQHFNPRFDHAKFMAAAGVEMKEPAEAVAEAKPDFLDMDKDGDTKEPMKKAIQDKEKDQKKKDIKESAEDTAKIVMAANSMVDKITGWLEDTAKMQTEVNLDLGDEIRNEMGSEKAEEFIAAMKPAIEQLYTQLETVRKSFTGGVAVLTGEEAPATLGADAPTDDIEDLETEVEPEVTPDTADDFTASEPATGGEEPADRKKRESIIRRSPKLAEMLSKPFIGKKKV